MAHIQKVSRRQVKPSAKGDLALAHQHSAPKDCTWSKFAGSITATVVVPLSSPVQDGDDYKLVMNYDEARRLARFIRYEIGL